MEIRQGSSRCTDSVTALTEALSSIDASFAPDLVVSFVSATHDTHVVARGLADRFPHALVIGCTTAGEILDGTRRTNALVLSALKTPSIRWAGRLMRDVRGTPAVETTVAALCAELGCDRDGYPADTYFALSLIDGLSVREETVGAALAEALAGIPVVGGSAGDGLAFHETRVFVGAEVATDAAAIVLARAPHGFDLVKHQHYLPTATRLAVTAADPGTRRVDELDGRPAAEAFAEAIGLGASDAVAVVKDAAFLHPVTFSCGGDAYVRSVRTVDEDGAMHFYCAVEEGMVLEVSGREDMTHALARTVDAQLAAHGQADLFLGFNCILRALEMEQLGAGPALASEWCRLARHSIGFDTYGELWNGLHINQTLVGVALHEPTSTEMHR